MPWLNLAQVLDKKGWSNYRFAQELGVTSNVVVRYYKEDYDPKFTTVLRWAEVLDCTVKDLIDLSLSSDDGKRIIPKPASAIQAKQKAAVKTKKNEKKKAKKRVGK